MADLEAAALNRAPSGLLAELLDGASDEVAWVLNPGDPGLLQSLDRLSAAEASEPSPGGGPSIAAHVDHLRYGLELLNRWSDGESPFADADYASSWRRTVVSAPEWSGLRDTLQATAERWSRVVREPRALTEVELTGVLASVVHLAYHLGAIRQINRTARGPEARD
jgi:hypothetical protein